MSSTLKYIWVLLCLSFSNLYADEVAPANIKTGLGLDHAVLEEGQSQFTEDFKKRYFFDQDGDFSSEKIASFLVRLEDEKRVLESTFKESELIEEFEIRATRPDKVLEKMGITYSDSKIVSVYSLYLIPILTELEAKVRNRVDPDSWSGLLDDFIRGYHLFYAPNVKQNAFPRNNDTLRSWYHILFPYKYQKKAKRDEAINLMVDLPHLDEIRTCLRSHVQRGHYLTRSEVIRLKEECDFDLSLLNPGVSAQWEERTREEIERYHQGFEYLFPDDHTKVYFDKVMLTGQGSPKVMVKATVGGIPRKYKVKWGKETHIDIGASHLAYHIGFNQDTMSYRKKIRVYLKNVTFNEFRSELMRKFNQSVLVNTIISHGRADGEEWFEVGDALFEARPDDEIRVAPFDPTALDLGFRRETNARILFHAFIGLKDGKVANYKSLLARSGAPKGMIGKDWQSHERPRILLRFQDMGAAFAPSHTIKRPQDVLTLTWAKYLANEFESSGVVTANARKDEISIHWNDYYYQRGVFENATYFDLKWMARKIIALSRDDIRWCLESGGMPQPVVDIYVDKFQSRQKEMAEAFELPFDIQLGEGNSPSPAVVNGRLIQPTFEDKRMYFLNENTWSVFLLGLFDLAWNQSSAHLDYKKDREGAHRTESAVAGFSPLQEWHGSAGLKSKLDQRLDSTPVKISLGVGLSASVSRTVSPLAGTSVSMDDMKARAFVVRDRLVIEVGADSGVFGKLAQFLGVQGQGAFQFLSLHYEYTHFADFFWEGWKKPLSGFLTLLKKPMHEAGRNLGRMESIRRYFSLGPTVQVYGKVEKGKTIVGQSVGVDAGWVRMKEIAYLRDTYGRLHRFTQATDRGHLGAHFEMAKLPTAPVIGAMLPSFSFLSLKKSSSSFKTSQRDLADGAQRNDFSLDHPIFESDLNSESLVDSQNGYHSIPDEWTQEYALDASGVTHTREFGYGFLFSKDKTTCKSKAKLTHPDFEKNLARHWTNRRKACGFRLPLLSPNLTTIWAHDVYVETEMEDSRPDEFTVIVKVIDFLRKRNRDQVDLLIESLNQRFSENQETPFYRDYKIPPKEEMDEYRRLYGMTRIALSGRALLDRIQELSVEEFSSMVENHFRRGRMTQNSDTNFYFKRAQQNWDSVAVFRLKSRMVSFFKRIQTELNQPNVDYEKIFPLLDKWIYHQKIHQWGIGLLQQLLTREEMLVYGEIDGILPSFTVTNDIQEKQRQRFAGRHWGNLRFIPPVQYHNIYDNYVYPSLFVAPHVDALEIFGRLPDGSPGQFNAFW